MPELPEVETFKRYLDSTSLHQRISAVDVRSAYVLKGVSPRVLTRRLKGRCFELSRRHGKHLFVRTDGEPWLRLHFGMTGSLQYLKRDEQPPKTARVIFRFANKCRLAFDDQRKFGEIGLSRNVDDFLGNRGIGPDALDISLSQFKTILEKHRGAVKAILLNQKLIAGIGNLYADEILFRAQMHPAMEASRLNDRALTRLFRATRYVLEKAIAWKADNDRLPKSWLLTHRGEQGKCPRCGRALKSATVGGRTSWFCAHCQKRLILSFTSCLRCIAPDRAFALSGCSNFFPQTGTAWLQIVVAVLPRVVSPPVQFRSAHAKNNVVGINTTLGDKCAAATANTNAKRAASTAFFGTFYEEFAAQRVKQRSGVCLLSGRGTEALPHCQICITPSGENGRRLPASAR